MKTIRRFFAGIGAYELVAFIAGFVLMAYEMVAARLMAPTIGSSMYVWTSVIGVMIAALAVGYAVGGWLADKRVAAQDIAWLLILAAAAALGTLLFYAPVLTAIGGMVTDQRIQGVIAAIALFMPASFLLGMVSPYLARLRVVSITTSGRSVARLSALNSIGGITGTFCVGFIFFSLTGSRETLAILVALLIAASWLMTPGHKVKLRAIVTVVFAVMLGLQFAARTQAHGVVADIDTPQSHYQVLDQTYLGRPARVLATDPGGYQSGIFKNSPHELAFGYTQALARVVEQAPRKEKILIIGGGVFTLPDFLSRQYPQAQIDVAEIDPQLPAIAAEYFNYQPQPNIKVFAQDARAFLRHAEPEQYDIILVDAYGSDSAVPFALATREYVAQIKHALRPGGVVGVNIIGSTSIACTPLLSSINASYASEFKEGLISQVHAQVRPTSLQNLVAVYADTPLNWAKGMPALAGFAGAYAQRLTDNYAPIEALWQRCKSK